MRRYLLAVLLIGLMLIAVACGGDDDGEAGGGGSGEGGGTEGLRVAYASDLDPNDIADQFGIQASGAEVVELTEDSAVIAGLIRGDVDAGNIGLTEAIKAAQTGVPIKIFYVSQKRFEFVMVSQEEIKTLDDLADKKVAYHSPGSGTEILQRVLVRQHDPALEDRIEWVVLPESPNRAAAMIAGEIDVTSLEFADVLTLEEEGNFNILGYWSDIEGPSANAVSTIWVASEEYYNENKETLAEFATNLQEGYDTFYEDKDAWVQLASETVDVDENRLNQSYDFYLETEMYPKSGEAPLTPELWKELDEFFIQIGEYEDPASEEIVDFDVISQASGG
ncbi:MAG: ABC transporter substrate-binding protein [Actinomycetota bacterium]|nr:ABC transporter substrate-binding protein [Actinomycetota bacterium]